MKILVALEIEYLLDCMLEVALSYSDFPSIAQGCRMVRFSLTDYPSTINARLEYLYHLPGWQTWYADHRHGPWAVMLRKDDPPEEQALSIGHEIAHVTQDFLRLGKEPRQRWPSAPVLIRKAMWKEDEEELCDLFAERWLAAISFRKTIFSFLEQLRHTDEFVLLS